MKCDKPNCDCECHKPKARGRLSTYMISVDGQPYVALNGYDWPGIVQFLGTTKADSLEMDYVQHASTIHLSIKRRKDVE